MSDRSPDRKPKAPRAEHGTPTEVSWGDGTGRQPYANRGPKEADQTAGGEVSVGDRGELSGRNLEQMEQVRKLP
jgi:hypothetical protein